MKPKREYNPSNGDILNTDSVIEAYFLNTQTVEHSTNESIILRTKDNKIILIDTANDKLDTIVSKLKEVSGSDTPTIDYLLISHSHGDHRGNLKSILDDDSITVNNIIYKKEKLGLYVDNVVNSNDFDSNINIIETTSLEDNGLPYKTFEINDDVSLILFNTDDVYKNETNCSKPLYYVTFNSKDYSNSDESANLKYNGKYIYLNSLDPDDKTLHFSDTIENVTSNLGLTNGMPNRRYYANVAKRTTSCNANSNSIAVLVKVRTYNGYKYMYIPSDLANNGYSIFGSLEDNYLELGLPSNKVYSTGTEFIYENSYDGNIENIDDAWSIVNDFFVDGDQSLMINKASESKTANEIKKYLGNDLHNLVIYQEAHHGINNVKDAIDALELNRNNVFSIVLSRYDGNNSVTSLTARVYHYTLNKTTILKSGINDGVYCTIKEDDSYYCSNRVNPKNGPTTYTVTFNSDGGSNVSSQVVHYNGKVVEPSNPTKNGYVFKEWQLNENAYYFNSPVTSNITLMATWESASSVIFDPNGGIGEMMYIDNTSSVNLPSCTYIWPGYRFKGWSKTASGTVEYSDSQNNITNLGNGDVTLYAIWEKDNTIQDFPPITMSYYNKISEKKTVQSYVNSLQLNENYSVNITGKYGTQLTNNNYLGTGSIIRNLNNHKVYLVNVNIVKGDVTGDGIVNIADVRKIADYSLSIAGLEYYERFAAEVTKNDTINIADVRRIADYSLNKEIDLWN